MEPSSAPCPDCRQPVGIELRVCNQCGRSLLVELRLRAAVVDSRQRFELGRQLAELGLAFSELKRELESTSPLIARGISRKESARFSEILSRAGVEFTVVPLGSSVPATSRSPVLAIVVLLVAVVGTGVLFLRKKGPAGDAPVAVTPVVAEAAPPNRPSALRTRTPEEVVASVVSVRCAQSLGSGFFVTPSDILTNAHVLCPEEDSMRVVTSDGLTAEASVVRRDDKLDLALVHVTGLKGAPLDLVDSTSLHIGAALSMVGSPKGLDFTTHKGNLSFLGRYRLGVAYLQVDIAVNPGNSGGPVLNESGQVVGVMSMMLTNANSIGLALPINYAREGEKPVWPEGPEGLQSETWRALMAKVAQENAVIVSAARKSLSQPALVKAQWLDESRIEAVVISPKETGDEQKLQFKLMRGDELLCEMFQTKTVLWEKVDLASNRDPQFKDWVRDNLIDEHLSAGLIELQWSTCRKVFESSRVALTLELKSGSDQHKSVPLAAHPAKQPPFPRNLYGY